MPEPDDFEDETGEEQPRDEDSGLVKRLRAQIEEKDSKTKALETKVALLEAGLDLSEKQRTALFATHEGDLSPEALKATAAELGFIAEQAPAEEQTTPEERAAHQRMQEATGGAPPADGTPPSAHDRVKSAQTSEELNAAVDALNDELRNVRIA
jgi:hypothetical protein